MAASQHIRRWYSVHKWSSLICTAFMLLLCLTGLPLIFHEEIDHWLGNDEAAAVVPAEAKAPDLDQILARGRAQMPGLVPSMLSWDDDNPRIFLGMAPPGHDDQRRFITFDADTGAMTPPKPEKLTFMLIMFHLHADLFAGLPGMLFLGLMGLLLVVAIVSGVVLYGPFMRKLDFGTVRRTQSTRLRWLDLHNLLGIVTLGWALVVSATGVINTLSTPMFQLWQMGELATLVAPYRDRPLPTQLTSVQHAVDVAQAAAPGMSPRLVLWPGAFIESNRHHYMVLLRGNTPLTSRLMTPVLVEADTGKLFCKASLPWYLSALLLSQPLHFGDYGGLPLKVLWALLDVITLIVLGSGLYLWLARRRQTEARIALLAERAAQLTTTAGRDV